MISAAKTFREISRKLEFIETNLSYVEPYEQAYSHLLKWPGFFIKDQTKFRDEIAAIRFYLFELSRKHIPDIDTSWRNLRERYYADRDYAERTILHIICRTIWPDQVIGQTYYMSDLYRLSCSNFRELLDHLILASAYYRHRCEQLYRSIVQVQRRFKERAYAPGGPLAQQAKERWQSRVAEN